MENKAKTRYDEKSGNGDVEAPPHPEQSAAKDSQDVPSPKSTKAPAFQFYPKDFFSSSKVDDMSMTERGVYITLLGRCWLDDGLPTDMGRLAKMARMNTSQFERLWSKGPLHECFIERGGRLHNERLDKERKAQADFRKKQKERAESRWNPRNDDAAALPMPALPNQASDWQCSSSSSAICNLQSPSKNKNVSAEPPSDSTPVVLRFVTVGTGAHEWPLTEGRIASWLSAYPGLDVAGECRKALAWVDAERGRRKTAAGMPRFLVGWLNRAVDRGSARVALAATGTEGRGRTGAPPKGKYDGIEEQD